MRTLSYEVAAGEMVNLGHSNEIAMLWDISENDLAFSIESDTVMLDNTKYFRNAVPPIPHEMAGNVVIYNSSSEANTFTFIIFYS